MSEMEGLKHIAKIREYCDYIEEHLLNVVKAWEILQKALDGRHVITDDFRFSEIDRLIREHDVSKLSHAEFIPYQQRFFGVDGIPGATSCGPAFDHHYENNQHHWENWTKNPGQFPEIHIVCMVCDWMAMSMKFGDTAEEYYKRHADEMDLPQWSRDYLGEIFAALRKEDENEAI